ncbi:MAG: hypothetical protein GDA49_12700 [Rhodospirillales bacterium]|nr:hypothetical protein [Rhodospirillales bacterium]
MTAMAASRTYAVAAGFLFGGVPWLLLVLCTIWGITVIADSTQFSASITELSEKNTVGTMLTLQTCLGFLLTVVTIHLMSVLVESRGWPLAFSVLTLGPIAGVVLWCGCVPIPKASGWRQALIVPSDRFSWCQSPIFGQSLWTRRPRIDTRP